MSRRSARPADSACVRHLLVFSAAGTVIGLGLRTRRAEPARAAARLRLPGLRPASCPGTASGPRQVLAGMWCSTMRARGNGPFAGDSRLVLRRPGPGRGNAVRIRGQAMLSSVCPTGVRLTAIGRPH
jgi:hypothetical protein